MFGNLYLWWKLLMWLEASQLTAEAGRGGGDITE